MTSNPLTGDPDTQAAVRSGLGGAQQRHVDRFNNVQVTLALHWQADTQQRIENERLAELERQKQVEKERQFII